MARAHRTRSLSAHGHRELTIVVSTALPVTGLEEAFLEHLEAEVKRGVRFEAGQTLQLGWSTLRLIDRPDGTLGLTEPRFAEGVVEWRERVDSALMDSWRQREVLESLDLTARAAFPRQDDDCVVCDRVNDSSVVLMHRTKVEKGSSDSGWFLGCFDDDHDHQSPDELDSVSLLEAVTALPEVTQFLALPSGVHVVYDADGPVRVEVLRGKNRVLPVPGSYLDVVNRIAMGWGGVYGE